MNGEGWKVGSARRRRVGGAGHAVQQCERWKIITCLIEMIE